MRQRILAIDLGKRKSVYCDYDPAGGGGGGGGGGGAHVFGTVATTPAAVHDLLAERPGRVVVIEVCPLAGWVSDLCRAVGAEVKVVNTADERWSWRRA